MRKDSKHGTKYVWITCSKQLEPVYAPLRNGKAHCTVCGEMWPTVLEGVKTEPPPPPEVEAVDAADAA